ncbi:MAG: hypothetical protein R3E87_03090 [Burkholderiaceae bacterium]
MDARKLTLGFILLAALGMAGTVQATAVPGYATGQVVSEKTVTKTKTKGNGKTVTKTTTTTKTQNSDGSTTRTKSRNKTVTK